MKVRDIVKEELELMREQMAEKPYAEPEPTWRFDKMTPEERRYIADQLGL